MGENQQKFQQLLRELFEFDMADLDFGIYRILNHKRKIIADWIDKDLPEAIRKELNQGALAAQQQAQQALEEARGKVLETLGETAIDVEGNLADQYRDTKVGREYLEAREKVTHTQSTEALEAAVYNHLYTFFSRYWQEGDFISKRRYSRKERYAIPYNGEEVYLYWANHDQYYVKTGEHFTDYTWKAPNGVTVHFKLKAADVEQDNIKGEKRFFLPVLDEIVWQEASPLPAGERRGVRGTLTIPFEYRPLTKQEEITYGGQKQQEKIIEAALQSVPARLRDKPEALAALHAEKRRADDTAVTYLEHHLRQYTARNTRDFFIHKDLKGFLSRELDFYLKNEVLNLEELEAAGEDLSDGWFQLMRLIKRVGNVIIEFLAQVEDFQKMLWEKKKFVTETFYVITVGNISENFYQEIAENEAQWKEWETLGFLSSGTAAVSADPAVNIAGNAGTAVVPTATSHRNTGTAVVPTATSHRNTGTAVVPTATSHRNTGTAVVPTATSHRNTGTAVVPAATSHRNTGTAVVPTATSHKGWHSRGYLPHFDADHVFQFITFRLHDSVPAEVIEQWKNELHWTEQTKPDSKEATELRRRVEQYEDSGHGSCSLRDERVAALVVQSLKHFDNERYRLIAWCVMPNHVHVLIEQLPNHSLSKIIHSWKSYTAHEANKLLGRRGDFWMPDYFDRFIRDQNHFDAVVDYIHKNPVKAGLVDSPESWPWSSAAEDAGNASVPDAPGIGGRDDLIAGDAGNASVSDAPDAPGIGGRDVQIAGGAGNASVSDAPVAGVWDVQIAGDAGNASGSDAPVAGVWDVQIAGDAGNASVSDAPGIGGRDDQIAGDAGTASGTDAPGTSGWDVQIAGDAGNASGTDAPGTSGWDVQIAGDAGNASVSDAPGIGGRDVHVPRVAFLKSHPTLPLDTRHFSTDFTDRLLASFDNLDEVTDGLLVHSENWQALNLLQEKYRERVKCIYIDPPFNSPATEIPYKNNYKHASWLSLIGMRIDLSQNLLPDGVYVIAIDENEQERLGLLLEHTWLSEWKKACIAIRHNPRGIQGKNVSYCHEYAYFLYPSDDKKYIGDRLLEEPDVRNLRDSGTESDRKDAKNCFYPFIVQNRKIIDVGEVPSDDYHPKGVNEKISNRRVCVWPIDTSGREKKWRYAKQSVMTILQKLEVQKVQGRYEIYFAKDFGTVRTLWTESQFDASEYGTMLLQDIFGTRDIDFSYPKSLYTLVEIIRVTTNPNSKNLVLDFFAGSGTTGHAVINLNREDGGRRKFILVEMAHYFDTVLLPRIKKVTFSPEWKDGKPKRMATVEEAERSPRIVKVIRLESYEDALNNLEIEQPDGQIALQLEDYLLGYMLKWETRSSATLLNVEQLQSPFSYKLRIHRDGETREQPVNLPKTFNYLIGLDVQLRKVIPSPNGRGAGGEGRYLLYRGTTRDGRRTAVIWRETRGWTEDDYRRDRDFVAAQKLTEGADDIFVNGDSLIPGARALESVFKAKMFSDIGA